MIRKDGGGEDVPKLDVLVSFLLFPAFPASPREPSSSQGISSGAIASRFTSL